MMALYAYGSLTTMNGTSWVFDLGSPPNVTGIVVVPMGEMESPVFNLVLKVTAFLGVVTIFSMEAAVPPLVAPLGMRLHRAWCLQEPLLPYLEKDLRSGRVEGNRGRSGWQQARPVLSFLRRWG
ncbi:hypothetical protein BHE74_00059234 [Ensete ventricosum]|nr:hypothetical protein BHE74_00059234 [Ensete ventricosum]